jgi:hypothetical protein
VTLLAGAALTTPVQALAVPATDEYTLDVPDAKGQRDDPASAPGPDAAALPEGVAEQLRKDPNGKALATIATADEIGAPDAGETSEEESGDDPSTLSAAAGGLVDPVAIGIGLAVLAAAAAFALFRRRGHDGA